MLKTKLHAPAINQNIISREKLLPKLGHARECKLTLVTAPAGYGKTTAVLDWLGKCGLSYAWVSLDAGDNDPATFWRYVGTALDGIARGIGKDTEYVLASREMLKANIQLNIIIDRLSEVQSDFLLVLDDLHLISDPSILTGLSYLIDYIPSKMHLVFISRTEPELELARHRIKWQIQRLEEEDLRFGEDEISRFYQARGITLELSDLKKVESYTEGWAAALVAVTLSMGGGGGHDAIEALSRSSRDIGQYLRDEVIRTWSSEKQAFAIKTSILDTLSEELCDAVTGYHSGHRLLKEIYEKNGFLLDLNGQKQEYRYHYLFKSFLRELLRETAPDEIPQLHARAGSWFKEHGMMTEAVEHYLNGGSYREAFELIEHQIDHLIYKNDFGILLSWVERLPAGYRDSSFKIAAIYALYYAETGLYDISRQWIGRLKALKEGYQYALSPEWYSYSSMVCIKVEANLLIREGNVELVLQLFSAAGTNGSRFYKIQEYNDFNTADIYFYRSPINSVAKYFGQDPGQYGRMVGSYRELISKNPGYAPLAAGEYFYESNCLDRALPYLIKAEDEAWNAGCPGALVPAMVDIARIKRALGNMQGAFEVLEECEKALKGFGKAHWIYLIQAFRCRLHMDNGDISGAEEWFASRKLNIHTEINRVMEFELIVYARVLMFKGRTHDARILLQRLLSFAEEKARLHSQTEVLNLLALLDYTSDDASGATDYLERSVRLAMKEGYIRSFTDEFTPMAKLLRYYITRRRKHTDQPDALVLKAYAKSLLKQMHENLPAAREECGEAAANGMLDSLTAQEKKVLKLIVQADTNQEISEKLGIGLRTVKNHITNLYGKLGVKNRAQCIKLVREAGLL